MRLKIDCLAARLCAVFLLMFLAGSVFAQNKITR